MASRIGTAKRQEWPSPVCLSVMFLHSSPKGVVVYAFFCLLVPFYLAKKGEGGRGRRGEAENIRDGKASIPKNKKQA